MWLVSGLDFDFGDGAPFYSPYILIADVVNNYYGGVVDGRMVATLSNTDTGEKVNVNLNTEKEYVPILASYKPYGYLPSKSTPATDKDRNVFVVIDDLSFKFLDLVDEIEGVRLNPSNTAYSPLLNCSGVFNSFDESRSIFGFCRKDKIWEYGETNVCTILQAAICAMKDGCWLKGACYLRKTRKVQGTIDAYKVSFTNQSKAVQFVRKAINSGYDMLEKFKNPTFFYGDY